MAAIEWVMTYYKGLLASRSSSLNCLAVLK
jgi:hypothetical protein